MIKFFKFDVVLEHGYSNKECLPMPSCIILFCPWRMMILCAMVLSMFCKIWSHPSSALTRYHVYLSPIINTQSQSDVFILAAKHAIMAALNCPICKAWMPTSFLVHILFAMLPLGFTPQLLHDAHYSMAYNLGFLWAWHTTVLASLLVCSSHLTPYLHLWHWANGNCTHLWSWLICWMVVSTGTTSRLTLGSVY